MTFHRPFAWLLLAAALTASQVATAAGAHTGNQFAVTESGAATITVPIQVPRGIGGMEPQLSLNYASGTGNGLLGLGWALSGSSAITRCPKTWQHDNQERGAVTFSASDRYCLDGQRLVIVRDDGTAGDAARYGDDGTTYRTERDGFSRITVVGRYQGQANMPNSFRVETKAGLVLDFGISANSQVLTKFGPDMGADVINRWMLQRISDRNGNYVEFVYCGGEVSADGATCNTAKWAGSKVLHYIRYTNRGSALNGTSAVVFGYETRPDRFIVYHYGSSSRQTQRLARIDTYTGFSGPSTAERGVRVRRYALAYEPWANRAVHFSMLASIQEINGTEKTPTDADKLPALEMVYTRDAVFGMALPSSPEGTAGSPPLGGCGGIPRFFKNFCP